MITEFFLDMIEGALGWLGGLLPEWDAGNPLTGFGGFVSHLGDLNYFIPIAEVFAFTFAAFMLFPAIAGVSLAVWLIALIRGGSARG